MILGMTKVTKVTKGAYLICHPEMGSISLTHEGSDF